MPGNAGTAQIACNLPLAPPDYYGPGNDWEDYFALLVQLCRKFDIDLVVVQKEEPLAKGITDHLEEREIYVFGANQKGALLEYSKIASQQFMEKFAIPHAKGKIVRDWFENMDIPSKYSVVKASGLARGKGVKVCDTKEEVYQTIRAAMVEGLFGPAGEELVVQERLEGKEVSVLAFSDGTNIAPMPLIRDYKKIGKGDTGENSGSVGCYGRAFWVKGNDIALIDQITSLTVKSLDQINQRLLPIRLFDSKGVVYLAFFITEEGPKVIEYNMRFGDPEAQVILPLLRSDLLDVMEACVNRSLENYQISWSPKYSVCVVLCSEGYPDEKKIKKGIPIYGLDQVPDNVLVFHAGTTLRDDGQIVTNGGRVLSVVGKGASLEEAREKVYLAIKSIKFDGMWYREDIAEFL